MSEPKKSPPKARAAKMLAKVQSTLIKDDDAKKAAPQLLELLIPVFEDGVMVRQPGKLTLRAELGSWLVQVDCPTEGVYLRCTVPDLLTCILEAEKAILNGRYHMGEQYSRTNKSKPVIDSA